MQQAHTKAHVLARDVRAYRTRSQDLLRVGQHQVETTGPKRVPRNFPFVFKKKKSVGAWGGSRIGYARGERNKASALVEYFSSPDPFGTPLSPLGA